MLQVLIVVLESLRATAMITANLKRHNALAVDEMGGRLDELEKSISDLVQQAGVENGSAGSPTPQTPQPQASQPPMVKTPDAA